MHDPLERLYRTKLTLLATVFAVVGLGLLVLAQLGELLPTLRWTRVLPLSDLGGGLFTTGLLGVALGYLDARDSEVRATERLQRVLRAEAPAIRDAVIRGFAFQREDLARVATPETLDEIIRNSLTLRLGDEAFAQEVYADIRDQAVGAPERWHDVRVKLRLSPYDTGDGREGAPLFVLTAEWEYSVLPQHLTRRFVSTSDAAEYRELAADPSATSAWYVSAGTGLDAGSEDAFALVQFTVNGQERPISRSVRKRGQTYTVSLGPEAASGQPVVVSYTYRTVVRQHGHLLHVELERPTRGVDVELDYSGCGIAEVRTLDFIASSRAARVLTPPASLPGRSVSVQFDGWVFPRSGVAFVWVLESEHSPAVQSASEA